MNITDNLTEETVSYVQVEFLCSKQFTRKKNMNVWWAERKY